MSETITNGLVIVRVCNHCYDCNTIDQYCTNKDLAAKRHGKDNAEFFGLNKVNLIAEGNLIITPSDCPRG
jgi:hypothetical protein